MFPIDSANRSVTGRPSENMHELKLTFVNIRMSANTVSSLVSPLTISILNGFGTSLPRQVRIVPSGTSFVVFEINPDCITEGLQATGQPSSERIVLWSCMTYENGGPRLHEVEDFRNFTYLD